MSMVNALHERHGCTGVCSISFALLQLLYTVFNTRGKKRAICGAVVMVRNLHVEYYEEKSSAHILR